MPKADSAVAQMVGKRFGRLIVLYLIPDRTPDGYLYYRAACACDCGEFSAPEARSLRRGLTKSCGCLVGDTARKHGESANGGKPTPEYQAWIMMIQRCTDAKRRSWKNYGGRGITVCREWQHNYAAFLAHVGRRPSKEFSIDRIDNDKGYFPGNVRWATREQQQANSRPRKRNKFGQFLPSS